MDAHLATHLGDPPALEGQVPQSFRPGAVDATELKHLCSICEAASIRVGPVSGARLHFATPWLGVRCGEGAGARSTARWLRECRRRALLGSVYGSPRAFSPQPHGAGPSRTARAVHAWASTSWGPTSRHLKKKRAAGKCSVHVPCTQLPDKLRPRASCQPPQSCHWSRPLGAPTLPTTLLFARSTCCQIIKVTIAGGAVCGRQ
jgi:hypothetical protein